jgi:hypothetical protein
MLCMRDNRSTGLRRQLWSIPDAYSSFPTTLAGSSLWIGVGSPSSATSPAWTLWKWMATFAWLWLGSPHSRCVCGLQIAMLGLKAPGLQTFMLEYAAAGRS